jgi:hypothetical protein
MIVDMGWLDITAIVVLREPCSAIAGSEIGVMWSEHSASLVCGSSSHPCQTLELTDSGAGGSQACSMSPILHFFNSVLHPHNPVQHGTMTSTEQIIWSTDCLSSHTLQHRHMRSH